MDAPGLPFPTWLSPELFTISLGSWDLALRWYALAYIAGLLIAWRIVLATMKRPGLWPGDAAPMSAEQVEDLLTWSIVGVILGGRLGFVLFYQPGHYLANPLEILRIWEGGMAFHGGFLGVVVATWAVCRKYGVEVSAVSDAVALGAPWGLFLGRIANFVNAELWGRPTEVPWAVQFPGALAQDCPGYPHEICARHPSQLYEATLEGLVLGLLLILVVTRRGWLKTPWATTGLFLAGYGIGRFIVEFFRQPDIQFQSPGNPLGLALHVGGVGLTMGQVLNLPMIALGLYAIWRARGGGRGRAAAARKAGDAR